MELAKTEARKKCNHQLVEGIYTDLQEFKI
jgi:hypothetical protein